MQDKKISKLISLTFDENPEVRIKAAEELAKTDDPAATFALIELSYDKDPKVQEKVREILEKEKAKKKDDGISFYELFKNNRKDEEKEESKEIKEKKEKLLQPIYDMFVKKLGKEKGEKIKQKMMPTIERIYEKAVKDDKKIEDIVLPYINAISELEFKKEDKEDVDIGLEKVGNEIKIEKIEKEIGEEMEKELLEEDSEFELNEKVGNDEAKTIFRKAYDLMMLSDGDEKIMKKQIDNIMKQMKKEVELAFRLAKNKFKANTITHLTKLKNGMRNVTTDILFVKSVEHKEYLRTKKKKGEFSRIVVADKDGSEGVIYLLDGRGKPVKPGMKIKVVKGIVKTFKFSGETALTIGKRGNVYIVL